MTLTALRARRDGRRIAEFAEALPAPPGPGHFYLALAEGQPAGALRVPLFPEPTAEAGWACELPPAVAHLRPGDALDLIGPCGRARPMAELGSNVLLIAGEGGPGRLWPAALAALARGAAVSLLGTTPQPLAGLPPEIEVRFGLEGLDEALRWAEVAFVDLPGPALRELQARLRAGAQRGPRVLAFRLPPTPCGVGACGACAVPTARGWRLACVDGPWFEAEELEG